MPPGRLAACDATGAAASAPRAPPAHAPAAGPRGAPASAPPTLIAVLDPWASPSASKHAAATRVAPGRGPASQHRAAQPAGVRKLHGILRQRPPARGVGEGGGKGGRGEEEGDLAQPAPIGVYTRPARRRSGRTRRATPRGAPYSAAACRRARRARRRPARRAATRRRRVRGSTHQQPHTPPPPPPPAPQHREAAGLSHDAALVAELKQALADAGGALPPEMVPAGDVDATLRRFLRARKGRVDAALAMLLSARRARLKRGGPIVKQAQRKPPVQRPPLRRAAPPGARPTPPPPPRRRPPRAESLEWRRARRADAALREPLDPKLMATVRECRPSSYIGFHREVG